jgi:hypothetical protein
MPVCGRASPFDLGVDARHDAQQGRFTGAVQAQHADLGAREEGQGDVLEDFTLGRHDLADPVHRVDVLSHDEQYAALPSLYLALPTRDRHPPEIVGIPETPSPSTLAG